MRNVYRLAAVTLTVAVVSPGVAFAGSGRDVLPNLVEVPPTDIHVARTTDGWVLRFTSTAGNSGPGPLVVVATRANDRAAFDIVQRISLAGGGYRTLPVAASLRFAAVRGHDHFHLAGFERYELRDSTGRVLLRDAKIGYCLGDRAKLGTPAGPPAFDGNCGFDQPHLLALREGITPGWSDPYLSPLPGQSFPLNGLAAGTYTLVNRVNDRHLYLESSYADDVAAAKILLTWPHGATASPTVRVLATCLAERCP